jgi:hypothetical protein
MNIRLATTVTCIAIILTAQVRLAHGQGYGSDFQNVMAPAAGGMAGVSIAQPQDVPFAIFGNRASLTQFMGRNLRSVGPGSKARL